MAAVLVAVMAVAMLPMSALTALADEQFVEIDTTSSGKSFRNAPINVSGTSGSTLGVVVMTLPVGTSTATISADTGYVISKIEATLGQPLSPLANLVASSGTLSVSDSTVTISNLNDGSVTLSNSTMLSVYLSKFKVFYKAVPVESVSLDKTSTTLAVGNTTTLSATVNPSNADQGVTWSSEDTSKATVDNNGTVTAVARGTVNIRATSVADTDKYAECEVTVLAKDAELVLVETPPVYNGQDQTGIKSAHFISFDSDATLIAKDAGTYTVKMTPQTGYAWKDTGTTETRTITWTIEPAKVTVPEPVEGLVYDGTEQTGVVQSETSHASLQGGAALYALTGNTATDAGEYEATAALYDKVNYVWDIDSPTSDDQTIEWSIAPKEISITWDADTYAYDGLAHLPVATPSDEAAEIVTDPSDGYTDAGTYTVTASLAPGTDSANNFVIVSGATHEFTITAAPSDDDDPSDVTPSALPKTGDSALPFAIALLVAVAGFAALAWRRSRQH